MKLFICILAVVAMAMADEDVARVEKLLADGSNFFTSRMFTEVTEMNPGKSVVMSGFSAMSPLAQLALASEGASHDEILKAIGFPNDNATKEAFTFAGQRLRSVKGVDLKIANRVFLPEGYTLDEDFGAMSREVFRSDVKQLNFAKAVEAASTINTWVEDNTNHRIKDLVNPDSLGPDTRAVLVNAIYFKGNWKEKFDSKKTMDRDFHVSKDKTIQVPTMFKNGDFKYVYSKELDAKLLEMFYVGEETSFLIVLPNQIDGLAALEEKLKDPSLLQAAISSMYTTEVDVYIPKFKIETTINLKEVLQKMDVEKLFDPANAKLTKLLKGEKDGLYVSDAIQKAFIEVNEEGAEAAAASAYGVTYLSGFVGETEKFLADHPFAFFLKEKETIIFNGAFSA